MSDIHFPGGSADDEALERALNEMDPSVLKLLAARLSEAEEQTEPVEAMLPSRESIIEFLSAAYRNAREENQHRKPTRDADGIWSGRPAGFQLAAADDEAAADSQASAVEHFYTVPETGVEFFSNASKQVFVRLAQDVATIRVGGDEYPISDLADAEGYREVIGLTSGILLDWLEDT
jgi:hypothetical protein